MHHLIWKRDAHPEAPFTEASFVEPGRLRGLKFTQAAPLPEPFPDVQIALDGPVTDYFMVGTMHVVSERLAQVITAAVPAKHIALYPVQVTSEGTLADGGHQCLHLLHAVDGLDWERSRYTPLKDWADRLEQIVLVHKRVRIHKLFRLARCTTPVICVREDLASEIKAADVTGVRFVTPEEWRR